MATNKKNSLKVFYDRDVDALSIVVRSGAEAEFDEIAPGVGIEKDSRGNVIGFELLNASRHFRTMLPHMAQVLQLKRKVGTVSWLPVTDMTVGIEGTGLGLYVARQLVEEQGGKIWAESAGENKGAAFIVELPLLQV